MYAHIHILPTRTYTYIYVTSGIKRFVYMHKTVFFFFFFFFPMHGTDNVEIYILVEAYRMHMHAQFTEYIYDIYSFDSIYL